MTAERGGPVDAIGPSDRDDPGATLAAALMAIVGSAETEGVLGLGWATVDLDRAESDFRAAFAGTFVGVTDAPDDDLLGAHCRIVRTGDPRVPVVVLLEPSTEARLSATLARHGEGPVAAWSRLLADEAPSSSGSALATGPFGLEGLVPGASIFGPHRLLVRSEPGTISS